MSITVSRRKHFKSEDMYDSVFSMIEVQTIKALETIQETGRLELRSYWLLCVLGDGAGVTFGKNQMTENGGSLYKLLFIEYSRMNGIFSADFEKYREILYRKSGSRSKKYALTENDKFKALLIRAAQEDPIFRKAQDITFHRNYFRPAVEIAHEYDVTEALGLFVLYDMCIQSGPELAASLVKGFNDNWRAPSKFDIDGDGYVDDREFTDDEEVELEREWVSGLVRSRHHWLATFTNPRKPKHTAKVRESRYRMEWILNHLVKKDKYDLVLPFTYASPYRSGKVQEINENNIYNAGG